MTAPITQDVLTLPRKLPASDKTNIVGLTRDQLRAASGLPMPTLSLGMSGDLDAAVAAGSTLVRIGTAVFGRRD